MSLLETLLDTAQMEFGSRLFAGEPIRVGDITFIPVITLSFGAGGITGKDSGNPLPILGSSVWGSVTPVAFVTLHPNGETGVLSIRGQQNLDDLQERASYLKEIIEKCRTEQKDGEK